MGIFRERMIQDMESEASRARRGRSTFPRRQHLAALKLFYGRTLGRPDIVSFISFPKDPERLPTVLGIDEIVTLLKALKLRRYRVLHMTVYSTGLRISEACSLETSDIDAERGVISGTRRRQLQRPIRKFVRVKRT
jgi:integrase/recombinase XerD